MGNNEIINMQQLSDILGYSVRQLQNYLARNQVDYFPPPIPTKQGCARKWLRRVIESWLVEKAEQSKHPTYHGEIKTQEKKKRGRPRKMAA